MNGINKKNMAFILLFSLGISSNAQAEETQACTILLCMAGKLTGNSGGDGCKAAEAQFFDMKVRKKGVFKASPTLDARKKLLMQCPGAEPDLINQILGKFGKMKG